MADSSLPALIDALRRLPGVGVKSASRMAFHLLQHDREGARLLARALEQAAVNVRHCSLCHTFTEDEVCPTCRNPQRDRSKLCVVETPADQAAVERTQAYAGLYFVLMGKLSPLDGVGPRDIGLGKLFERATAGEVQEVILATNFTAEGEATAHVIAEALKQRGLRVTRLARGVPAGSELEYVDLGTIAHALVDPEDEVMGMGTARFTVAYWCVLLAVLLPLACAWLAKYPGMRRPAREGGYDNADPRGWLARQQGWSARANAAQANSFEALPFFIGAVIIAHQLGAPQTRLDILAVLFITLRIIYIVMYVANLALARSAFWTLALLVNVGILFSGWR